MRPVSRASQGLHSASSFGRFLFSPRLLGGVLWKKIEKQISLKSPWAEKEATRTVVGVKVSSERNFCQIGR